MKKKYYINILGMIALIFLSSCCSELEEPEKKYIETILFSKTKSMSALDYYWYNGNKIPLTKLPNKKFVIFKADTESSFQNNLKTKGITLNSANIHVYKGPNVKNNNRFKRNVVDDNYKWATIDADDANKLSINNLDIIYEAPYYKTESGDELRLSNIFYVKLKSVNDINILQNLAIEHNVELLGETLFQPLWIVLSCTKNSSGNALDMSNLFYETGLFDKVDVNFTRKSQIFQNVNDPYFSQQWGLKSSYNYDIKYLEARSITQGSGSTIAIIDQGVQLDHPDISNVRGGYDPINNSTSQIEYGGHGTSVAGIFGAATNNGIGIASVAPSANVLSISYPFGLGIVDFDENNISNAFYWAVFNGADVINCSWGISSPSNMINDAISFAFTEGRLGKGCIIVFAVGNEGTNGIKYPANSFPEIVAVGGSDKYGGRWDNTYAGSGSGSNYGTQLDIVAPGTDIVTTESKSGYTDGFLTSGTSFSAPFVSGVAALILSVNPNLTQKEVVDIIEKSARKLPNYSFSTYSSRPNGTWNNEVGYGLLDAYAALLLAQNSTQNPEVVEFNDKVISSDQTVTGQSITSTNVVVQSNATLTLRGTQSMTLNTPFIVNNGSTFIMEFQ